MPRGRRRGRRIPPSSLPGGVPTLVLSASSVSLSATAGDTATTQSVITARSGTGASLGGVGIGTVTEDSGSGWLSATVQQGFPALVTIVCDPDGLSAATYTGSVQVTDPQASNSPRTVTVSFVVAASAVPSIVLSNPTMTLSVQQGNAATVTATCLVTSGTAAPLAGPSIGTITGTGSTGVTAAIVGNTITVTGASAALTNASSPYTATVPVVDASASNTPQNITVTLNVAAVSPPPTPTMALSASAVALSAEEASGAVASTTVTVSSANGAALGTTSVGTVTGTGASAISTSVAGHVVTINAAVGSLAAGVYTLTVPILDSLASNSPQDVTVTFTVSARPVGTTIPAAIYLFNGTPGQNLLISRPFPLRPGDMTDQDVANRKFRLYISGVEQSIYTEALRGRHSDGSLRAILVQFYYDVPNTTPIVASVTLGSARATTDLPSKVPVTQFVAFEMGQTPYGTPVSLLPTSPAYLCQTLVSGSPLVPAAQMDATSYALYGAYMDERFEALKNAETASSTIKSEYEHIRGLVSAWCMTGNVKFYTQAMSRVRLCYEYSNDTSPASYNPTHNLEGVTPPGAGAGGANEAKSQRMWHWFVGYYLTAWPTFYATSNGLAQQAMRVGINNTTYGYARSSGNVIYLGPRFNMARHPGIWVAALMDATRTMSNPSGGGVNGSLMPTELPRIWDTAIADAYVENAGGDGWRNGYLFVNNGYRDDGVGTPGEWPLFQSALIARHMVDYYLMVHADPDLPSQIKLHVDGMIRYARLLNTSDYGGGTPTTSFTYGGVTYQMPTPRYATPYLTKPSVTGGGTANAWTFPMWAPAVAFVAKYYGGDGPDGVAYTTWYDRTVNPGLVYHAGGAAPLTWSWKIWAETFGGNFVAPWIMAQPGPPQGPATLRTPTVYTTWPT